MHIDDLFHSPASKIAAFAQMQLHLYRHDPGLQEYFEPLQLDTLTSPRVTPSHRSALSKFVSWGIRAADRLGQLRPRRTVKTDILFCPNPDFSRKAEVKFLERTLLALAQTGARILCLLPSDAPCRSQLDAQLASAGRTGQVTFLDLDSSPSPIEARLRWRVARMRGLAAFEEAVRVLEPHGLSLGREVEAGFVRTASFVDAWERLAPWVEFDSVVVRCHWHALCSSVCRTARQRGKPSIAFQQGVVCHTLDVPVTASKFVAFGPSSASFLARMNRRFFQAAGIAEPPVEYVSGGSLFDTVTALPNQFALQTVLMLDVPNAQSEFYGLESQNQAVLQLTERLLTADLPLRRLIIRPHPYWSNLDLEPCLRLMREHPGRCELSHPAVSLEDDLRRSSAVFGIFSGVLSVASACGLPTVFLETEGGYTTGDLACFSRQSFLPDAAFTELARILGDPSAYADARTTALQNAREYYANGTSIDLNAAFFERLLRTAPAKEDQRSITGELASLK